MMLVSRILPSGMTAASESVLIRLQRGRDIDLMSKVQMLDVKVWGLFMEPFFGRIVYK